jgi:lysophospholipase L1-like esterase
MGEVEAHRADRADVARALLLVAGGVLAVAAILYNRFTLSPLAEGSFQPLTLEKIRHVQLGFALAGVTFLAAALAIGRWPHRFSALGGRPVEWLLFGIVGLLPIVLLDFGLRPFVEPMTRIFVADEELGWRMRPGVEDEWGGVRVRVNERGLRGPVLAPHAPPGSRRVLFLGDSVTFGFGIADERDLFVSRAGDALARALDAPVEVLNAGVGGYSPWQERIWLEREGLGYAPDLLVVDFVLNDVTEKLSLVRYGGTGRGWQLARTASNALERWASASALFTLARRGGAVLLFGRDVQLGAARREAMDVSRLALDPTNPRAARAWELTLHNLDGLLDVAEQHGIPSLVVIFPYRIQLHAPHRFGAPQRHLARHLRARGTPVLDLLPRFAAQPARQELMLDPSHLSVKGHALAAEAISECVLSEGLLVAPRGDGSGD